MEPDVIDTLAYYSLLLIIQYRMLPKASATMTLFTNEALCSGLPQELEQCFNLNVAIGNQLNILGNIVGVPRNAYGLDLDHTFFSFIRYQDTTTRPGFGRYNDNPYPSAIWLRYLASGNSYLTDFEMQACIILKIIQNNSYTSLAQVAEALWQNFGDNITVVDNLHMKITYHATTYGAYYSILQIAQFLNILPKPMGVQLFIESP